MIDESVRFYGGRPEIDPTARIDAFSLISTGPMLQIGRHVHIAAGVKLYGGGGKLILSDYCSVSMNVTILTASDNFAGGAFIGPMVTDDLRDVSTGDVVLEPYSAIGCSSTVMPGVRLGKGATLGAHSLLTKSIPAGEVWFGVPTRRIGVRNAADLSRTAEAVEKLYGSARLLE